MLVNKREALSVTDLNLYIKDIIAVDDILGDVLVKGEISNFKGSFIGTYVYVAQRQRFGFACGYVPLCGGKADLSRRKTVQRLLHTDELRFMSVTVSISFISTKCSPRDRVIYMPLLRCLNKSLRKRGCLTLHTRKDCRNIQSASVW